MRMVDGIEVPETIGEARTLNYEQLKKACDVFNDHGISAEDIKKQWDNHWWDGFNIAMNLVYETLNGCDFTLAYTAADIIELIEQEEDLYKNEDKS